MNINSLAFLNQGQKISAVLTTPIDPTELIVILVHGGPGGNKRGPSDIFVFLAERLANEGIASLRFDLRGSGDSEGDFVDVTIQQEVSDLQTALGYTLSLGYQKIGLVGESLGGTVAILGYDSIYKAVVLWFPAIYLTETSFSDLLTEKKFAELDEKGYISEGSTRIGRSFIDEIQHVNVEASLKNIKSPVLIIQGNQDREVPPNQSLRAMKLIEALKRLEMIEGGDHGLRKPHEQEQVINMTVSWFKEHLVD